MKRFVLYLARWQASTPILWLVVSQLGAGCRQVGPAERKHPERPEQHEYRQGERR